MKIYVFSFTNICVYILFVCRNKYGLIFYGRVTFISEEASSVIYEIG